MSDSGSDFPKIPLATAIAIVVANMVGTGVFTSLGFQVISLPTGFPILVLWLLGGLLAFCGAVCYAELAAMNPRSGGEYHLLASAYHPAAGFLSGWISVTVGFAAPVAAAALAFGEYLSDALQGAGRLTPRAMALIVVVAVTAVHLVGIRSASRFQLAFTLGKVLLIVFLVLFAFGLGNYTGVSFSPFATVGGGDGSGDGVMSWSLLFTSGFAISLYWVMYAYSGWNAAAYVVGEMDQPRKNVPLALLLGTGLVTLLYVGLNCAFLWSTPVEAMEGQKDVAYEAAKYIFDEQGATIVGFLICFGLISTISSMIWAGPRVTQVMAEDYKLFRFLSFRNKAGSPTYGILIQLVVALLLVFFFDFERIIYCIQAILMVSSAAVVVAVIYLRVREPNTERPYRAWGYPVTPILFLVMSVYMLIHFVKDKLPETLVGLAVLGAGAGVYFLAEWYNRKDA